MDAICGMRPFAFTKSDAWAVSSLWWTSMPCVHKKKLNDSWLSQRRTFLARHRWPPDWVGFLLKCFASSSSSPSPRRQKTWWHQDERQPKKRRNGAENWREIKWIDKVGASEKKMGKWIDCDGREREREGRVRRVMLLIHWSCRGRCTPFFFCSKCYRKTYITMTALWPRQPHKKNTLALFHLPQTVINKNHTKKKMRESKKRKIVLWGGLSVRQREVKSNGDSHLDLSVWWNKPLATIPYSTLSADVTSEASLFPSLAPLPSIHLCPYFFPSQTLSLSLSLSQSLSVLSVSDTQWIREYLAAPLSDLSSSPTAPLCLGLSIRQPLPGQMPPQPLTQLTSARD